MSAEATTVAELSVGAILLIVLPATIALIGVIVSTIISSVTTHRAEDRRARNMVSAQVLESGRQAELEALYAVAEFVAKIKNFNRAMSGNTGKGADDRRAAKAFEDFSAAFDGFDTLTRAAMTVQTLGATEVSDQISAIRSETLEYVMALGPPLFKAKEALAFEERLDLKMRELVSTVRRDFATDAARATRPGT